MENTYQQQNEKHLPKYLLEIIVFVDLTFPHILLRINYHHTSSDVTIHAIWIKNFI